MAADVRFVARSSWSALRGLLFVPRGLHRKRMLVRSQLMCGSCCETCPDCQSTKVGLLAGTRDTAKRRSLVRVLLHAPALAIPKNVRATAKIRAPRKKSCAHRGGDRQRWQRACGSKTAAYLIYPHAAEEQKVKHGAQGGSGYAGSGSARGHGVVPQDRKALEVVQDDPVDAQHHPQHHGQPNDHAQRDVSDLLMLRVLSDHVLRTSSPHVKQGNWLEQLRA
eukprot:scaffold41_cov274-Pinguiococcus_pyrenoidosus.AAC.4